MSKTSPYAYIGGALVALPVLAIAYIILKVIFSLSLVG